MNKYEKTCEFCHEIKNFKDSRVGKIYKEKIRSRVIKESENFVVLPTIGQIVPKSLLILPKDHFETFAEIPSEILEEVVLLISDIEKNILTEGNILFEHGAKKCTSSSCGVYHAHIHIVPINKFVLYKDIVGDQAVFEYSLKDTLRQLANAENYILFRNIDKVFHYNTVDKSSTELFKSQYFRKWLVKNFNPDREWDWKKYDTIETDLLESLV